MNEFELGQTCAVATKDWVAPDGSGIVPGKAIPETIGSKVLLSEG